MLPKFVIYYVGKLIMHNDLKSFLSVRNYDFIEGEILDVKINKIIRRRLSKVYILDLFTRNGKVSVCIKVLNVEKNEYNISKRKLEKEYKNCSYVYDNFSDEKIFRISKPLHYSANDLLIVTELLTNYSTLEANVGLFSFLKNKNSILDLSFVTGGKLAEFHRKSGNEEAFSLEKFNDLREYLLYRLTLIYDFIRNRFPSEVSNKLSMIIDGQFEPYFLERTGGGDNIVLAHCDFTPANILWNGRSLALIDFADTKYASRYMDLACYIHYHRMLHMNYSFYNKSTISKIQERFLTGYDSIYKVDKNILEIYLLRYLLTNTLTNIYEYKSSRLKMFILEKRISRYVDAIFQFVKC